MRASYLRASLFLFCLAGFGLGNIAIAEDKGARNDATAATKAANQQLLKELPFADKSDFESAHKGFIAPLPSEMLKGEAGNLIWNPPQFSFIAEGAATPDTSIPVCGASRS